LEENLKLFCHQARTQLSINKVYIYKLLKSIDEVTEKIKSYYGGRRFFITRKGYIGLCPLYAKQEDLIYIIPSVYVPIILRGNSITLKELYTSPLGATKRLKLVGECYVHGLINGEALLIGITQEELEII
jgi:hypothetical protein